MVNCDGLGFMYMSNLCLMFPKLPSFVSWKMLSHSHTCFAAFCCIDSFHACIDVFLKLFGMK